jgi:hypothetical protein
MVIDLPIDRAVCQQTPRRPGTFERWIHRLANSLPKQREKKHRACLLHHVMSAFYDYNRVHLHPVFSVLPDDTLRLNTRLVS